VAPNTLLEIHAILIMVGSLATLTRPYIRSDLPGPNSAELLIHQQHRESNARTYPRHLPIAIGARFGNFVRDVDGNVFIDFLSGAGMLSLGHSHPELVAIVSEQVSQLTHCLDFPTPAEEVFTSAQLSMLDPSLRKKMKLHFCGPTRVDTVDAAVKLCKTATGPLSSRIPTTVEG
jgi:diaminobutyrate-2-oxoglutarate transaminase